MKDIRQDEAYITLKGRCSTFAFPDDVADNFDYNSSCDYLTNIEQCSDGFILFGIKGASLKPYKNHIVLYIVSDSKELSEAENRNLAEKIMIEGLGRFNESYYKYLKIFPITRSVFCKFISLHGRKKSFFSLENPLGHSLFTDKDYYAILNT